MAKKTSHKSKKATDSREDSGKAERIEKWAALAGRWTFDGPRATFLGPAEEARQLPMGLAVGAPAFRDGRIRTTVTLTRAAKTTAGIVVGYQSLSSAYVVVQMGAYGRAYAISEYQPGLGWIALADAGLMSNLDVAADHVLEIELLGQSITMFVDGVNVLNATLRRPLEGTGMGLFAWDDAEVRFGETWLSTSKPRLFVMMPFQEPYDTLYQDVIRPIADELHFKIVRVDEIQTPGIILEDIQRQIAASHAVVAEISSRNPNVFYELGFAHALKKPAVLLVRREESERMPFDVKAYRAIFYDDSIGGKKTVEANLRAHLHAVRRERISTTEGG